MRCARLAAGTCRWVVPVLAGVLVTVTPVSAQRKRDNGDFTATPLSGTEQTRLQQLRDGQALQNPKDQEVLDHAAKFYVFRLTEPKYQFPPSGGSGPKPGMHEAVQEVFKHFPDFKKLSSDPTKADNQQKYIKEFSNRLAAYVLKILDSPAMIARVNGVILLSRLGESGQEELADPMCQIIEDKNQGDAVKLYALRGLRNLFDNARDDAFRGDAGEERLVRCLKTLTNFLGRKPADGLTEPEREAFEYVRREAVRALGASRVPVVEKRRFKVSVPSLDLVRVAAGVGLEPPPSLSERVEAAAGLARMRTKNANKYQPEVPAYYVGRVVVDFATQYDKDRSGTPSLDYKYYAFILDEALVEMKNQTGGKSPYVNAMIDKARPVLRGILTDGAPAQLPLKDWLDADQSRQWGDKELFQGDPDTAPKRAAVLKEGEPPAPPK